MGNPEINQKSGGCEELGDTMKDDEIKEFIKKESLRVGMTAPGLVLRKMKATLGIAYLEDYAVCLNREWIHRNNGVVAESVILHEMLHLKNYRETGEKTHTKTFKDLCKTYGCHERSYFPRVQQEGYKASHDTKNFNKGQWLGMAA